jgi:GNAT superfamily N-acetyltransferase
MTAISIREALPEDAPVVTRFIRLMLEETASMGGHRVAKADEEWKRIQGMIEDGINSKDHVYLLADVGDPPQIPIGVVEAQIVTLGDVFEPKKVLHIRSVYVLDNHRRKGIARALLRAVLDWGRSVGCAEAGLNVLSRNPARTLYEKLGFRTFGIKMVRKL